MLEINIQSMTAVAPGLDNTAVARSLDRRPHRGDVVDPVVNAHSTQNGVHAVAEARGDPRELERAPQELSLERAAFVVVPVASPFQREAVRLVGPVAEL